VLKIQIMDDGVFTSLAEHIMFGSDKSLEKASQYVISLSKN